MTAPKLSANRTRPPSDTVLSLVILSTMTTVMVWLMDFSTSERTIFAAIGRVPSLSGGGGEFFDAAREIRRGQCTPRQFPTFDNAPSEDDDLLLLERLLDIVFRIIECG